MAFNLSADSPINVVINLATLCTLIVAIFLFGGEFRSWKWKMDNMWTAYDMYYYGQQLKEINGNTIKVPLVSLPQRSHGEVN